jgi:glutamate/tyrosine decarboxylase-like PLP-dependent enzyme
MEPEALREALAQADGPMIVCAEAGNMATGAFDAFEPIADACATHDAWLHIDGAFGLWAAAAPATRHLTHGVGRADSWAVDAHKWLNVPYDAAMAIAADPDAHVAAMRLAGPPTTCSILASVTTPTTFRKARGVPVPYLSMRQSDHWAEPVSPT